jgi:hypothetical protein
VIHDTDITGRDDFLGFCDQRISYKYVTNIDFYF